MNDKKDEALKLALEALEQLRTPLRVNTSLDAYDVGRAITALREALASEALDRMAENARELGLDYEPVWGSGPTNKDYEDSMRQKRLHQLTSPPAQRKPLTDEQRNWVVATCPTPRHIIDTVEKMHGIKGDA